MSNYGRLTVQIYERQEGGGGGRNLTPVVPDLDAGRRNRSQIHEDRDQLLLLLLPFPPPPSSLFQQDVVRLDIAVGEGGRLRGMQLAHRRAHAQKQAQQDGLAERPACCANHLKILTKLRILVRLGWDT
jgi:hypothetical protein